MNLWNPIATAPRDGTSILSVGMGVDSPPPTVGKTAIQMACVIYWREAYHDVFVEARKGMFKKVKKLLWSGWEPSTKLDRFDPTHWMPIPKMPSQPKTT